jgi:hypothetical protein
VKSPIQVGIIVPNDIVATDFILNIKYIVGIIENEIIMFAISKIISICSFVNYIPSYLSDFSFNFAFKPK